MYIGRESLAADGTLTLTPTTGAKMARIELRGGNFSFAYGGTAPSAGTWHSLQPAQVLELEEGDFTNFKLVRDSAGMGTAYVSYFDRVSLKQNHMWNV